MRKGVAGETRAQIPYNVEVGSAVYNFTFNLDLDGISRVSTRFGKKAKVEDKLEQERPSRVKVAMRALTDLFSSLQYGAKRTRFHPNVEPLSAVVTYSKDSVFIVSPGNYKGFIGTTLKRIRDYQNAVSKIGGKPTISMLYFDKESATEELDEATKEEIKGKGYDTLEGLAGAILDLILKEENRGSE
jgi:CRISPR-associated protein Csa2